MSSTIISEPFQLYLSSTLPQKTDTFEAIYTTYNRDFPGYATVTAQSDGIYVWDLHNHHAVASYSVMKRVKFAGPAFSLYIPEDGDKSVITYVLIGFAPTVPKSGRCRTLWVIRQCISGPTVAGSEKTDVTLDFPPVRMCGTSHPTLPLLFVSKNGGLFLANVHAAIKSRLDWPGEHEHVETFVFLRNSCSFIQDDVHPCSSVAITCCLSGMTLHVRLALLGEEITPVGTCDIPIASSSKDTRTVIRGLTCSPQGILSFIDSRGRWATHQLISLNSSLTSAPISKDLRLCRLAVFRTGPKGNLSVVSLGISLVLLAALVEGTQKITLQVWDLSYGVLLEAQSMAVPSELPHVHLSLAVVDEGQIILTVSPFLNSEKVITPKRSSIHVVPVDARLTSSIARALGKSALTAEWLSPKTSRSQDPEADDKTAGIISSIRGFLEMQNAHKAERVFLAWVDSLSSKEAVLGHELVKKIFNIVLPSKSPSEQYTPRITRCLLENAVVSTIMLNGRLLTMLRQRGDWENLMFALSTVADISEDELMASAKFLIDRQRKNENAMDVDASYAPPLWSYLFACVSYPFSVAPMRLAIRKYVPDAQDLVLILEILETWIQGGTEHEVEALLKSTATSSEMSSSKADSPPYHKVITFLHALLDASFVALLQYPPSHELLRRILSCIQPEISFLDSLEPLRGLIEPFARAQLLKEKMGTSQETTAEWRKRKKQLTEQASLSVGLYRLEELAI